MPGALHDDVSTPLRLALEGFGVQSPLGGSLLQDDGVHKCTIYTYIGCRAEQLVAPSSFRDSVLGAGRGSRRHQHTIPVRTSFFLRHRTPK